jgi:hypothetical protein
MKIKINRKTLTQTKGNLGGSPFQLKDLPNAQSLMDKLETAIVELTITKAKDSNKGGSK